MVKEASALKIEKISVGIFAVNCYVIYNSITKNAIVIDPGDEIIIIKEAIDKKELKIKSIFNTHCHIDHAGKVAEFLEIYKTEYFVHKDDLFWLNKLQEQASIFGLEVPQIPTPTGFLNDKEEIDCFLGYPLKIIHTPGHTPGSTSFLINNHLFTGDTLFKGSIGRTDFPKSSFREIMHSIKEKLLLLPPETIVHPGHGEDTTISIEKFTNPFLI